MKYYYGMRLRGCSLGCQPKGFMRINAEGIYAKYYDILVYERQLTEDEVKHYSLDFLGNEL